MGKRKHLQDWRKFSPNDILMDIMDGKFEFGKIIIDGTLAITDMIIDHNLLFEEVMITGRFFVSKLKVKNSLAIHNSTIQGILFINETAIGEDLSLLGSKYGGISITGLTCKSINVSAGDKNMHMVHYASPTTPISILPWTLRD